MVSNPDFRHIERYIAPENSTPVIVAERVNWISREQWLAQRQRVMQLLSSWIFDWESLDHERYRNHYSRSELNAFGRDFQAWDGHKRWVNRNKTWVQVEYSQLNIFNYPGEQGLMLMQFEQSYRSNTANVETPKELYWRNNGERWQIVHEGVHSLPVADRSTPADN